MRTLVKVSIGVLIIAAVGVAVLLGPAHVEIRSVAPRLPDLEALRALSAVEGGPVRIHVVVTSEQPALGGSLGHSVFFIEWADGRRFMIDAGMDRAEAAEFADLMQSLGEAGEPEIHGSIAELAGEILPRVEGVGFTHLHIDHTQGIEAFCGVRGPGALLAQTPDQRDRENLHTAEGAALVRGSCLAPAKQSGQPLISVAGFPGFGLAALGGHTPGSTLFAAAIDGHIWVFSGDISNMKADLLEDRGKGFVYSTLIVPEDTDRTAELRAWLREVDAAPDMTVVVSHDLGAIRAIPLEVTPR